MFRREAAANQLMVRGKVSRIVAPELAGSAVATAVHVRGPAAKPDGKRDCKTAGNGCDQCV